MKRVRSAAGYVRLSSIPNRGERDLYGDEFPGLTGPKMADLFLESRHIPANSIGSGKLAGVAWSDIGGKPDLASQQYVENRIKDVMDWANRRFRLKR